MESLIEAALLVVEELLKVVAILLAAYVIQYLRRRLNDEQMKLIEKIVADGILFTQQVYGHLDGPARFDQALMHISAALEEHGIHISPERLRILIEAILKELKMEYGQDW